MRPRPTAAAGHRGVALIEAAAALPLMIILVTGVLDLGLYLFERQLLFDLARDGARLAAMSTKGGADLEDEIQARLNDFPGTALLTDTHVAIYKVNSSTGNPLTDESDWTTAKFGESIVVEIGATYRAILPSLLLFGRSEAVIPTRMTVECLTTSEFD
jgi:Flp pilus assembly protein TadG